VLPGPASRRYRDGMCGRYTLVSPGPEVAAAFGLVEVPMLEPRFNIAPSQRVPVVRAVEGRRALAMLHWGLVPPWAGDPSVGSRMINARSETAAAKPAFRDALRGRRCLLPADGFYEWAPGRSRGGRVPHRLHAPDGRVLGLAGLWETWRSPDGGTLESCTILTTEANDRVRPLHDRMPVILSPDDYGTWLDPSLQDAERLTALLRPAPAEALVADPASRWLNDPRHEGPACWDAAARPADPDAPELPLG